MPQIITEPLKMDDCSPSSYAATDLPFLRIGLEEERYGI
jgi:hypothetical protein